MKISIKHNISLWQMPLARPYRYKVIYGGRGSGKSYAVADILLITALQKKCLIICGREFQNSIKDSVHSLLKQRIESLGFAQFFEVTRDEIRSDYVGSRFIFKGLHHNIDSIKSMAGITHLWIEEADTLSAESWKVIKPTIREEDSEIWITMNPKHKTDILYREFIEPQEIATNTYRVKVNWQDNPYFPSVLKDEMERDKIRDFGLYQHIWEGECLYNSEAQVFKQGVHWDIENFEEPPRVHPYYGLDFGFSPKHPTVGIRCYIHENKLYITHEAYAKELLLNKIAKFLRDKLPDLDRYYIYADNARPDNIAHLKSVDSLRIKPVEKGKGTVEDGIEYMKTFSIVINPRCVETIKEFTLYSYQVDARSGDIKRDLVKDNDHCIDSIRYGLERLMKRRVIDYSKWRE